MIYLAALKRFWPHLVVVFATLALCAWLYSLGAKSERVKANAEIAELKADHATTLADLERTNRIALQAATDAARAAENKRVADMAALDLKYTTEMTNAKRETDAALAAVRSGELRLRDRFTCNSSTASGSVPETGAGPRVGDDATPSGLQVADAAVLVQRAADADEVVRQLTACQAIVRADRQ